ncbi:hypothetical protein JVT61DRAFT_9057 [Boletus reticuloceps]|uniref:Uncharacterized protein n=1 Tax=Boletus reticuloceps TaxID=495285 RepID=A0A8I2YI17_9AGAM|nr:hypothetical protein JVT61DRAFT_9057 [Boletus reticuloceps]
MEADGHKGPSVVLAYLPYHGESSPALELLKEAKIEVKGEEPFTLDSNAAKNNLQQFLDRKNHLSQLVHSKSQLAKELVSSLGESVKEAHRRKAQQAYDDLLVAPGAPPLLVLYASDGGTVEEYAKKLVNRAKVRGILAQEEDVAIVTSTAGQGEPSRSGHQLSKPCTAQLRFATKSHFPSNGTPPSASMTATIGLRLKMLTTTTNLAEARAGPGVSGSTTQQVPHKRSSKAYSMSGTCVCCRLGAQRMP